jgi:hypothetical protein
MGSCPPGCTMVLHCPVPSGPSVCCKNNIPC